MVWQHVLLTLQFVVVPNSTTLFQFPHNFFTLFCNLSSLQSKRKNKRNPNSNLRNQTPITSVNLPRSDIVCFLMAENIRMCSSGRMSPRRMFRKRGRGREREGWGRLGREGGWWRIRGWQHHFPILPYWHRPHYEYMCTNAKGNTTGNGTEYKSINSKEDDSGQT